MAAVSVYLTLNNKESCVAVLTGLSISAVLVTAPKPTIDCVIPLTVPEKEGFKIGAFKFN